ncbi:50S ribosomal protein L9 [Pelagibius litoralis]|uniref:Large ribosomal subunit protein bL9 n=1 Tax=Pelagibius litoralis TaxID=374515 RepID=A0A967EZG1_9PROT|nr:50S ribosomal protein L9 [Pelagibius litoralis]NIA70308.1 50S ribosomal protein L9 [Pelagibius litoralis]
MDVILMERIEKLGQMGDVVSVKPGYARNFLLPQKKALRANKGNMAHFEQERVQLEADNLKRREEAQRVVEDLEGLTVTLVRQAGESGQLYGSVNSRDIGEAVTEAGITVERRQVALTAVIKTLGMHPVRIQLHPEVSANITANVARSEEEAKAQLESGRVVTAEDRRQAEEAAEAEIEAVVETVAQEEGAEEASDSDSTAEPQPAEGDADAETKEA